MALKWMRVKYILLGDGSWYIHKTIAQQDKYFFTHQYMNDGKWDHDLSVGTHIACCSFPIEGPPPWVPDKRTELHWRVTS